MISQHRIIYLAYLQALDNWYDWKKEIERRPESELAEIHERESWKELKEIENMLIRKEKKDEKD